MHKTIHVTPAAISLNVLLKDRLRLLSSYGFHVVGFTSPENNSGEFERCGFRLIESRHLTRAFDLAADFRYFVECYRVFRQEKPLIVNTYGPKPGIYARIAARMAGVPVVVHTSWGMFFSERGSRAQKIFVIAAEKCASFFCDYIFSVNADDLGLMKKYRFRNRHRLGYLGNATDIWNVFNPALNRKLVPAPESRTENGDITIGCVGRLTKAKGFPEFFQAAGEVKKRYPYVRFSVVGIPDDSRNDGVSRLLIDRMIKEETIDFQFSLPHSRMAAFYGSIDIMVLPSHREGFPRSLVEAAAMGKPIITTDARGCREAVRDGENGILVPPGNAHALQQAMETLVRDKPLRIAMGKKSREKAEREFDMTKLVETIANVYNQLLSPGGR